MSIERVTGEGLAAWSVGMTAIIGIIFLLALGLGQLHEHAMAYPTYTCDIGQKPTSLYGGPDGAKGDVWCTPIIIGQP